jgi:7,8-dihydropterin-6-yl-methyl-4-(beta-D-ribofuranosyl)aminobenzene 5'-phosphate synthase
LPLPGWALLICMLAPWLFPVKVYAAEQVEPRITILSTMVANFSGEGEWGFSAVVETEQESILFDTGFKSHTVLNNAKLLGVDLSWIEKVVLTHFHTDHTGGLLTLREAFRAENEQALSKVYVAKGFFQQRFTNAGTPVYSLPAQSFTRSFSTPEAFKNAGEALGIEFIVIDEPTEIAPGMILSGPIERVHDEKNVSPGRFLKSPAGALTPDHIPESQVMGIHTNKGWVLVSGCGHAGIVNASEALKRIEDKPIHLGVGGFHLFRASDQVIDWTASQLQTFGLQKFVGAHCTGAYATHRIADLLDISRKDVSIGAIGTQIEAELSIRKASID